VTTRIWRFRPLTFFSPVKTSVAACFRGLDALAINHSNRRFWVSFQRCSYLLAEFIIDTNLGSIRVPFIKVIPSRTRRCSPISPLSSSGTALRWAGRCGCCRTWARRSSSSSSSGGRRGWPARASSTSRRSGNVWAWISANSRPTCAFSSSLPSLGRPNCSCRASAARRAAATTVRTWCSPRPSASRSGPPCC